MPILKQKNAKSTGKVAASEGFKPKVQVIKYRTLRYGLRGGIVWPGHPGGPRGAVGRP